MIRSMTGFGTASELVDGCRYVVEIRAVNGRYLKCHVRLPEELQGIESGLEEIASKLLDRGSVTVTVRIGGAALEPVAVINPDAVKHYLGQLKPLAEGLGMEVQLADVLSLPGVFTSEDEEHRRNKANPVLQRLVKAACGDLDLMRRREGEALQSELTSILAEIRAALELVRERSPIVVNLYQERLRQRMETLLSTVGSTVGSEDLVREVAVFAERSDIAEEVSRLGGHLDHFQELMCSDSEEPVGRTLDFLAQEMLRETNTIGSKCLDSEVSRSTVLIKGAVDRLKEQVQNIR
ncbi:MAG: YicC family protein [Phycisphaerales bacterium]|nr:YicC family protein [Phycisphaerales bacterium]